MGRWRGGRGGGEGGGSRSPKRREPYGRPQVKSNWRTRSRQEWIRIQIRALDATELELIGRSASSFKRPIAEVLCDAVGVCPTGSRLKHRKHVSHRREPHRRL